MFNKGAMTLHERQCKENPNNKHQCFKYCKFLEKGVNEDGETTFECIKIGSGFFGSDLYSYKLERLKVNVSRMVGKFRMPLQCDVYESDHYQNEITEYDRMIPDKLSEAELEYYFDIEP
jgi:hypothetical protein